MTADATVRSNLLNGPQGLRWDDGGMSGVYSNPEWSTYLKACKSAGLSLPQASTLTLMLDCPGPRGHRSVAAMLRKKPGLFADAGSAVGLSKEGRRLARDLQEEVTKAQSRMSGTCVICSVQTTEQHDGWAMCEECNR